MTPKKPEPIDYSQIRPPPEIPGWLGILWRWGLLTALFTPLVWLLVGLDYPWYGAAAFANVPAIWAICQYYGAFDHLREDDRDR